MTDFDAYDEDYTWPAAIPEGTRHNMACDDEGHLLCCGQVAALIAVGDAMTADPQRVTCPTRVPA